MPNRESRMWIIRRLTAVAACAALSACMSTSANQPVVVGLLVPYGSGQPGQEALADSLVSAAKLAVSEMPDARMDLRIYPTAGDPAQAAAAARQAVSEGAKILAGPLFAQAANAAGAAVASQGINVLSFSNNPGIARDNVFILGDTFANIADRLVGYASAQGKRTVVGLVRSDAAGDVAISAIRSAALGNGAQFVGVSRYQLSAESTVAAVTATRDLIDRTGASVLIMDADAAGALPVFAQLLPENGVSSKNTQFVGLARWDRTSEQVRKRAGMQGSLFAMPDTTAAIAFSQKFTATYGVGHHILAGKAYDAVRVIGALLGSGSSDALTRSKLTRRAGFSGSNGVFRLQPDGTNQRALAVATFRDGQIVVLDPAPRGFGGTGF
ncbi:MAG: penicillin-binding protein activator [Rhodobacteraceae bacterium]|nr:penicillin-binding protein activator [Paracoccaceae bacterium]